MINDDINRVDVTSPNGLVSSSDDGDSDSLNLE